MSDRMTDERLAEIEATLYEDTDNIEELLQALKAERTYADGLKEWMRAVWEASEFSALDESFEEQWTAALEKTNA